MIEIQLLENQRREAKRQMFLTKPLRGYLGNQYHYWENEFKTTVDRINQVNYPPSKERWASKEQSND